MKSTKTGTQWILFEPYPVHIGFCPSPKAWAAEMKRLGPTYVQYPAKPTGACTTALENPQGNLCVIVTCGDDIECPVELVGALFHEAVHCWQRVCERIGEKDPGWECEAYAIQQIGVFLMKAYADTRLGGKDLTPPAA